MGRASPPVTEEGRGLPFLRKSLSQFGRSFAIGTPQGQYAIRRLSTGKCDERRNRKIRSVREEKLSAEILSVLV
jgi:hypothetical protein